MKKKKDNGIKLVTAAMAAGVLAYFAFQALSYIQDPLSTTLAYPYQVETAMDLSGYVVRREQVLPDDSGGLLRIQRTEGEKVSAGGVIAAVYADQSSLDRQMQVDALETQLEQLQYAQSLSEGTETKLDGQITQRILDFRRYITSDRLAEAEDVSSQLRALVIKRDYGDTGDDLPLRIQDLEFQLEGLRSQTSGAVRRITAPTAGLYSAETDGLESTLTPESLEEMTPSRLSALRDEETPVSRVGKLVLGDVWYYAAVMPVEDYALLTERQSERGGGLTLRFAKGVDRDLSVTLAFAGPQEGNQVVAVFQGNTFLRELTLLRAQRAQIIYGSSDGIRIPKAALRAEKSSLDEEGKTVTEKISGVYCVVGREARFKPVEVLYSGDNFVLVQSPAGTDYRLLVRAGEEIIVSAKGLYDHKILE